MKKINEIEIKLYEKLGVRFFRKLAYGVYYMLKKPIVYSRVKDKDLRKKMLKSPDNYNMKTGNGMQDLRDFKKMLLINASLHIFFLGDTIHDFIFALVNGIPISYAFAFIIPFLLNGYCIMLQRYNQLRINKVLEKGEKVEARKKVVLCEQIKKEEFLSKVESYKLLSRKNQEEVSITLDDFLNSLSLQDLKFYKESLDSSINFYKRLEENNIPTSDNIMIYIAQDRSLKLELKK